MFVSDFIEDLQKETGSVQSVHREGAAAPIPAHLILGVQHDLHTSVRGGDVWTKLHAACRQTTKMKTSEERRRGQKKHRATREESGKN